MQTERRDQVFVLLWIILMVQLSSCTDLPLAPTVHLTPSAWVPPPMCTNKKEKQWHIFAHNIATGVDTQLTEGAVRDSSPTFSPGGERVAFIRDDSTIQVLDLSTGTHKIIAEQEGKCSDLKWSPGGKRFAFVADRMGTQQVYIMNADGTGTRRLTRRSDAESSPYWLPGGKQIAFISVSPRPSKMSSVYTATVAGESSVSEVLVRWCESRNRPCESFLSVAWSPDRETMAVVTQSREWGFLPPPEGHPPIIREHEGIGVIVVERGSPRLVAQAVLGGFYSVSWSPDGGKLLYYSGCVSGFEDIAVLDVETGEHQRLFGVDEQVGHVIADPAWSPDGVTVVYSRASCGP